MEERKFTQEEINDLKKDFGAAAVNAYFQIADELENRGINALAKQIQAGTKQRIDAETERITDIHNRHRKGESDAAIAARYNISTIEVAQMLKKL